MLMKTKVVFLHSIGYLTCIQNHIRLDSLLILAHARLPNYLSYKKQHKEGTCKVSERSVVYSAFYAGFLSLSQINDYHHLKC